MLPLARQVCFSRGLQRSAKALLPVEASTPSGVSAAGSVSNSSTVGVSDEVTSFFSKLPEKLILESNGMKPTTAENQLDTLKYYKLLTGNGFTLKQTNLIIQLLLSTLNEQFFDNYNSRFLRNMELENHSHLFNAAQSELRYSILNSREVALNEQNLQLMKVNRELNLCRDELNELIINFLKKDSRVDFNDHQSENTLLHRDISIRLKDGNNKIGTKIIGQIKFEIENLRWHTTRSGLFAVLILVFLIMSGVSISKRTTAENERPTQVVLHTIQPEERELEEPLLSDEQFVRNAIDISKDEST
ncbi:Put7p Ecym_3110 [Eremothecium cymbalariae DBVPG|uniref:Uncharacterized protein n=1 Tax=Eremothecium cymbalariae (strain CBS 270.75 / DBVPG 7215 / KCTC 17166 / NRRL Y-17582) TaxID=931890 RepID=G8JR49_ERECY|nr:Hypothetical protein Ecym_3110 [Eremothecium cymbalariae DBVPG\